MHVFFILQTQTQLFPLREALALINIIHLLDGKTQTRSLNILILKVENQYHLNITEFIPFSFYDKKKKGIILQVHLFKFTKKKISQVIFFLKFRLIKP